MRRNPHPLARSQNIKILRIENQRTARIAPDRIPEIFRIVILNPRQIDERRMLLRAITDDLRFALQIDRKPQPVLDSCFPARVVGKKHEALFRLELPQQRVGWRIIALEQPQLRKPFALPHHHAECARHHFRIQPATITRRDDLELAAFIRDQPRENIQAPGGTLRVRLTRNMRGQGQLFLQGTI